jgi:hypothetical protein
LLEDVHGCECFDSDAKNDTHHARNRPSWAWPLQKPARGTAQKTHLQRLARARPLPPQGGRRERQSFAAVATFLPLAPCDRLESVRKAAGTAFAGLGMNPHNLRRDRQKVANLTQESEEPR